MATEHDAALPHGRARTASLASVALLAALVFFPAARWLVHRWSLGVWFHSHGFAVPPIAAWLIHRKLKKVSGLPAEASRWGFAFLVPAVLLQVLDSSLRFELPSAVALILAIPGLSLLLLGRRRTKAIWFGLFFLVFAIPIPLLVARQVHMVLRVVAATSTEATLSTLGYDVTREGTLIHAGPESIQIADACSGFSTLMALGMVGLLLVYLTRSALWRKGVVLLLLFPIAALANIVRCVVLTMLVVAFGMPILDTAIHPLSGIAAFILALLLTQAAIRLLMPPPPEETQP